MTQPVCLWGSLGPDSSKPDPALPTASLVHLAQPWAHSIPALSGANYYQPFPAAMLQREWDLGRLVLLDWISWDLAARSDPTFALPTIIAGNHDVYLHQWAAAAAAWKHPFLLRFDPEMNGSWLPYGASPVMFVSAWRHVVDIFRAEGATNATWHWCPNVLAPAGTGAKQSTAVELLEQYYPGDSYVDWTGFDAYNGRPPAPWMTFSQLMTGYPGWLGNSYEAIAMLADTKPMLLGEWGCWDDPRKPAWLLDALTRIPQDYPAIRGLSYFNWDSGNSSKWPLSGDSLNAFKLGTQGPVYLPAGVWVPSGTGVA